MATQQREAVDSVLADLDVEHIPYLCVWNKVYGLHSAPPTTMFLYVSLNVCSCGEFSKLFPGNESVMCRSDAI